MNFISLFSGGGGADIGAMMAGYTPVAANEYDPAIAEVYRANIGNHIRVGDILQQDPHDYPPCDLLHLSPPCPNFSVAKAGASETTHDIALAEKCAEFIRVLAPRAVTVENVTAYRDSKSYQIIIKAITDGGYMYDAEVLNSADMGVPQTRRRFIVRAVKGLLRPMPAPVRWIGWYEAIEDLIDTLPASKFAPWQLTRLPEGIFDTRLFSRTCIVSLFGDKNMTGRTVGEPSMTVVAREGDRPSSMARAFIVDGNINDIVDGQNSSHEVMARPQDEGAYTVINYDRPAHIPKAFIIDGKPQNYAGNLQITQGDKRLVPLTASQEKHPFRAWLSQGHVVKMTPRALARFQSFPDWYKLPEKTSLACRIIGNACPPIMMQAIFESLQ